MLERQTVLENESPGLIEKWIEEISPALGVRGKIISDLENNAFRLKDGAAIFANGMSVPSFLLPTISLWARRGPAILCSYCHPEEFDLYKIIAHLNLAQLTKELRIRGFAIAKQQVLENWYETVALNNSATQPLNFGDFLPKDKLRADILGISDFKFGSASLDLDKQRQLALRIREQIPQISGTIVDKLSTELDDILKEKAPDLTKRQRHESRQGEIKDLITDRLVKTVGFVDGSLSRLSVQPTSNVNNLLFEIEQRFAGFILGERTDASLCLSEITGIEGRLSSANTQYTSLVMDTLDLLVEATGTKTLKRLVNTTGDGLFLGFIEGEDQVLTVDKDDNNFILMRAKTGEIKQRLADSEVLSFARQNNFMPLAKTESLALISGGVTLHMGSEHGNRGSVLAALDLDPERFGEFADYLVKLRVGGDLEQGSEPLLLNGTKAMPAVLAFILFGEDSLSQMLFDRVGVNSAPVSLTEREVKKLAAEKLVECFLSKRNNLSRLKSGYRGYLWG